MVMPGERDKALHGPATSKRAEPRAPKEGGANGASGEKAARQPASKHLASPGGRNGTAAAAAAAPVAEPEISDAAAREFQAQLQQHLSASLNDLNRKMMSDAAAAATNTNPSAPPSNGHGSEPSSAGAAAATTAAATTAAAAKPSEGGTPENGEERDGAGRPKRAARAPERLIDHYSEREEHDLVTPDSYSGAAPGSGAPGAQPFRLQVAPAANLLMDLHAHCCNNEVCGLLAGRWDEASRQLRILRAFPVKEMPTSDEHINVEMDPEDQVAVNDQIRTAGLSVVGW